MLLSVDPGVHHHGCALWEGGELIAAWMSEKDTPDILGEISSYIPVDLLNHVVIECMQVYASTGVAKANDLLAVNWAAGELVGDLGHGLAVTKYKPRAWKGQVPKGIMVKRIIQKLSIEERSRVELPTAASKQHNVWDGVGIGLKYWGRI